MPCRTVSLPGGGYAIVCGGHGPRQKPCVYCGKPSSKLCDFPIEGAKGETCDRPLCERCAVHVEGKDEDYCHAHAKLKGLE